MPKSKSVAMVLALAVLPLVPAVAQAQAYPDRPVRMIAPYPPGGSRCVATRRTDRVAVGPANRPSAPQVTGSMTASAPAP